MSRNLNLTCIYAMLSSDTISSLINAPNVVVFDHFAFFPQSVESYFRTLLVKSNVRCKSFFRDTIMTEAIQ